MYTYGITGTSIDEFQDTTVTAVTGGQALVYNDVTDQWENTDIVGGTGIDATYTGIPANFEGLYNGGAAYGIGDVVIADGAPYGIEGNYYIRTTNPGNPGYPPAVGGGNNAEWDEYPFSVNIEVTLNAAIDDLSDVVVTSPAEDDLLQYNNSTDVWENKAAKTVVRDNTQQQGEPQAPANGRLHGPNNSLLLIIGVGVYVGGVMKIVFNQACTVTEVGLVLASTYTNATSRDYRLGAYADNGTGDFPGALIQDLGLVTIAQNATAGFKGVALATPLAVAAGTTIWTAVNCQHIGTSGTFPSVAYGVGNSNPYASYGIATTGSTNAVAFSQNGTQATVLANPYVLQANPVTSQAVVGYVKVTVP